MQKKAREGAAFREVGRRHWRWFALWLAAGAALRAFFILRYPLVEGDSYIYGDIAKNWLLHGVYGLSTAHGVAPTYIRLPGYPAFLVIIFKLFGMENYPAAMWAQMALDLAGCFVIAALAWELCRRNGAGAALWREADAQSESDERKGGRAARFAFALAAACPFTANYVATPLAESWAIFLTGLALYLAARAMRARSGEAWWWLGCGGVVGAAIMMRPDDGLLPAAIGGVMAWQFLRGRAWQGMTSSTTGKLPLVERPRLLRNGALLCAGAILLVAPWTWRNARAMHRFQPLAPFHANDPGQFVAAGFDRWLGTWVLDTISVYDISFHVPGEPIDPARLPARAWGDAQERRETEKLIAAYNRDPRMAPAIDAGFAALAAARIREHPLRYYIALPLGRLADMWLRPRTELLPVEMDWWKFDQHAAESAFAAAWAAVNLLLLALAIFALRRSGEMNGDLLGLMIGFVLLRCALLAVLSNPEPRYTLECFPVVLALGAIFIALDSQRAQRVPC